MLLTSIPATVKSILRTAIAASCCLIAIATLMIRSTHADEGSLFADSAEYKRILDEVGRESARPSRLAHPTGSQFSPPPVKIANSLSSDKFAADAPDWHLEIDKNLWGFSLINKKTGLGWRLEKIGWISAQANHALSLKKVKTIELSGKSYRFQVEAETSQEIAILDLAFLSSGVIRLSVNSPAKTKGRLELQFAGSGPFFGLGERFTRAMLDGTKTTLHPEDLLGRKPDHNWTYVPVPFLFTPRGLGVFVDSARFTTWDVAASDRARFSVEVDESSTDFYFFVNNPKGIVSDYTALTGRSPAAPPWTFGVWICASRGPFNVLDIARRLRDKKIPSSAIWIWDAMGQGDIMGWPLWWTGYYADPRHFTDQLHSQGFKVLTYVHPYLRAVLDPYALPNPNFEEAQRKGFFVRTAAGQPSGPRFEQYVDGDIDFTKPDAVAWWEQKVRSILVTNNFDGWMEDFGEWVNDDDQFATGRNGKEMANLYPLLYHRITYEISQKYKRDAVEFDRSGFAGSQASTPVIWGGDQFPEWTTSNGLPSVIPAGITAGLSGFAIWGPDIDSNGHSKELFIRWTEFGALTPVMRDHLWDMPAGAVDLWYDAQTTDVFRRYAQLHLSLFPYFYSYSHQASQNGLPIIRHPMLEFPEDPQTYDAEQEYMLGEHILVAPVIQEGATTRSLYLPQGDWANFWNGEMVRGGHQVTVPAPLDQIPILVQSGSILPFINSDTASLVDSSGSDQEASRVHDLIWRVFPASHASTSTFRLWDGTSASAEQDSSHARIRVENSPMQRHYEVILPSTHEPRRILLGNAPLPQLSVDHESNEQGWRLDANDHTLHVIANKDNFDLDIAY
jgi:alpha-D-xyloside xylohydrolase